LTEKEKDTSPPQSLMGETPINLPSRGTPDVFLLRTYATGILILFVVRDLSLILDRALHNCKVTED